MNISTKRIVFISLPHMLAESEEARHERGLPLVVVSGTSPKGIVLDYSKTFKACPIKKGIFLKDLKPLRGKIGLVTVDYDYIEALNQRVISYLKNYSPCVESPGAGEYYIDLTGTRNLFGRELDTCGRIIAALKNIFHFTSRIGVGSNTLISWMASQVAEDGGVYDIWDSSEGLFLSPLRLALLPELSSETKDELAKSYNIHLIRDLLVFTKNDLASLFGKKGLLLYGYSRGLSRNYIIEKKTEKTLKRELAVSSEENDDETLRRYFFHMIRKLCLEMRKEYIFPRLAEITVVYQDNYRYTYSKWLKRSSFFEKMLYEALVIYLDIALKRRTCIKKIILSFSQFTTPSFQEALFYDALQAERLARAFDLIQKRFGKKSIQYGA